MMSRSKKEAQPLKKKTALQAKASNSIERYNRALQDGYQEGLEHGYKSFETHLDGTSIIIPSDNELKYVKRCIESINTHTDSAYEIIVIDNNSTDGTKPYLMQQNGLVRYHILTQKSGFAGAVNRGLMMAKGTTIVLLDNQAVVTGNWLKNMMICLQNDPDCGLVGPVSDGMNGIQHFDMKFINLESMQKFASWNNSGSDQSRWGRTEKLSAKCLLFRRELLEKVGFLDEGFHEDQHAEDDFIIRIKLQGFSLAYAGDAFIHLDSEEKDSNNSEDQETRKAAPDYFAEKWIKPKEFLYRFAGKHALQQTEALESEDSREQRLGQTAYYPQAIAVKGLTDTIFWIEDHMRRPIEGIWDGPVIQLSQLDLRQWKIGDMLTEGETLLKLNLVQGHSGSGKWHGTVCINSDGDMYYLENGKKRAIISPLAAKAWNLEERRKVNMTDEELNEIPDGLPVIAPICLRQAL